MHDRYDVKRVHADELEALIEKAEARDGSWRDPDWLFAIDADVVDVNDAICADLEYLLDMFSDDRGASFAVCDFVDAAAKYAVKLGLIYEAPGHEQKVVELDQQGFTDASACAAVETLPEHVVARYAAVLGRSRGNGDR